MPQVCSETNEKGIIMEATQLTTFDVLLEKLEAAFAQGYLGFLATKRIEERLSQLAECTLTLELDGLRNVALPALGDELHRRLVGYFNFKLDTANAFKAQDRGEDTEFDPDRMEADLDTEHESIETMLVEVRTAFDQLNKAR